MNSAGRSRRRAGTGLGKEYKVEAAIRDYVSARRRFLAVARRHPGELGGNDNIIGRIGEYVALKVLRASGRRPIKAKSRSQAGFDFIEKSRRISVKVITDENRRGRGVRLTEPWDELVLVRLCLRDMSCRLGLLTKVQFKRARAENPGWSGRPIVKTTMLGEKGLVGKYGEVKSFSRLLGPRAARR